ncbi:MAG: acyl--CoA ligase, partial [Planctomycetes bacterium]|nr:acyl--CoA ligase [Planctomycetota bacterium]
MSKAQFVNEAEKRRIKRMSRTSLSSATPAQAKKAASAKLAVDKDDALSRWFDDPLTRKNEFATIRDLIEGQANRFGTKPFLIYEESGKEYSYRDLDAETSRVVNLYRALGVSSKARIGILDANTPEMVFLYLGAMKGGFTSAPLNYHLKGPELHFCLENSESELLFVASEFFGEVRKILPQLGFLKAVVVIGKAPKGVSLLTSMKSIAAANAKRPKTDPPPLASFEALAKASKTRLGADVARPTPNTQAEIIYTSGTTGKPKGVILRHHQFCSDCKYIARWYRMTPDTRMMMVLPLFHVNAEVVTTVTPLITGGSVVMFKKFSASRFWPAVEKYRVNIVSVVPTILTVLAGREQKTLGQNAFERGDAVEGELPAALSKFESGGYAGPTCSMMTKAQARRQGAAAGHNLSSLQTIICGAAPLPAEVQLDFERTFLIPITEGYGLSETTCYSTFNPIEGWRKIATIGVEVGNQVNMFDSKLRSQPANEMGEIVIRGENVMLEYFKRDEANVEAFAGGWFHSGDVGEVDLDGFIRIRDRVKDMIIRGG